MPAFVIFFITLKMEENISLYLIQRDNERVERYCFYADKMQIIYKKSLPPVFISYQKIEGLELQDVFYFRRNRAYALRKKKLTAGKQQTLSKLLREKCGRRFDKRLMEDHLQEPKFSD